MALPTNSAVGGTGVGGNAGAVAGPLGTQRMGTPSPTMDPAQFGGGAPIGAPGVPGVGPAVGGAPAQAGGSPLGALYAQAFQTIVQRGFAEEDLQTTQDFIQALIAATQSTQSAGPEAQPGAAAPLAGPPTPGV